MPIPKPSLPPICQLYAAVSLVVLWADDMQVRVWYIQERGLIILVGNERVVGFQYDPAKWTISAARAHAKKNDCELVYEGVCHAGS